MYIFLIKWYNFLLPLSSNTAQRRAIVKERIQQLYDESHQNYGAPKITKKLNASGEKISERTVSKYMNEMGIKVQYIKPYTVTTKDSDFSNLLDNVLNEQFNPSTPNAVWCTDIIYLWTNQVFVYLTSIMDLFSRKIISRTY